MDVFSCERAHIEAIEPQSEQAVEFDYQARNAQMLIGLGFAFSFWQGPTCVAAAGVAFLWPGCGQGWAIFSRQAGSLMVPITRYWRGMLDEVIPYKRVQATAVVDYEPANRWLVMLGFEMEAARMKSYDWAGRDHALYARVRS